MSLHDIPSSAAEAATASSTHEIPHNELKAAQVMGFTVRLHRPGPMVRAAVEFVVAVNAFRPLSRRGYLSFMVFAMGWRASEVPHLFVAMSVIDVVRRGRRGDFAGRRGTAALGLTALSWAILAVVYRRAVTSRPQLMEPLREELGADYPDALARHLVSSSWSPTAKRPAGLTSPPRPTRIWSRRWIRS